MSAPRPRFDPLTLLAIALLACTLSGCIGRPLVAVERVQWGDIGQEHAVLNVDLAVSNAGSSNLELREMHYRVSHNGIDLYEGRRATEMTLTPDGGAMQVQVPAVIRRGGADGLPNLGTIQVVGTIEYFETGRLALVMRDLGIPNPTAGFAGTARMGEQE